MEFFPQCLRLMIETFPVQILNETVVAEGIECCQVMLPHTRETYIPKELIKEIIPSEEGKSVLKFRQCNGLKWDTITKTMDQTDVKFHRFFEKFPPLYPDGFEIVSEVVDKTDLVNASDEG